MTIRIGLYLIILVAYPIFSIVMVSLYHYMWHDLIWFKNEPIIFSIPLIAFGLVLYRLVQILRSGKIVSSIEKKLFCPRRTDSYLLLAFPFAMAQALIMFLPFWGMHQAEFSKYLRTILVPGKVLNIGAAAEGKFIEGHLSINDPSAVLIVTYAQPNTVIKEGDFIKASTDIRRKDWDEIIKASKPIHKEVGLRFALQSPVTNVDTPIEIRGYFTVDAYYPIISSSDPYRFENVSNRIRTAEVSFVLLPVAEEDYFIKQKARESNFTGMRLITIVIGLLFYISVLIDPRQRKQT
jgi:hypothetical protein